jgi:tRNA nucleotidyltransferase (CCA-adding enzyme)
VGTVAPALVRQLYRRVLTIAFRDPISVGDLAVDGEDLRRAGVPAGPRMGRMLQELLDEVLVDPARNRRELLLALVAERLASVEEHERP